MMRLALFHCCHALLALLIRHFFGLSVEGAQRLPQQGPCLLAANHNSHLDTALVFFLLGRRKQALQVLAAQDHFFTNRFIHFMVVTVFHALAVNRERFSPQLLDTAREVMQRGDMLLIYPEGGRGDGSGIRRFKPGVGYLALHLDVPVYPLHISGTARAFPKGAFWPRPHNVLVRVGEPLHPREVQLDDASPSIRVKRITQLLEQRVRELGSPAFGPWALVTGASSGAGRAISVELARRGFNLLLTARSADALQEVAEHCRTQHAVVVEVLALDLADAAARSTLLMQLQSFAHPVKVLVNNAGMGAHAPLQNPEVERHQQLVQLNVAAVVALTDALLPPMLARHEGMILNVGSVYSVVPAPGQAVYSGSKAFVRSWSRALQRELYGTGVSLTLALPGSFESGFHTGMGIAEGRKLAKHSADEIASTVVAAMIRRRSTVVPGLLNKLFLLVCTFLPQRVSAALMHAINRLRGLRRHDGQSLH